jgi:hypothetical protein
MVTELLREWAEADPFTELPLATAGTAGRTVDLPFTGVGVEPCAFCAEEADWLMARFAEEAGATTGAGEGFFCTPAAEAYEVAVVTLVEGAETEFCEFAGDVIRLEKSFPRDDLRVDKQRRRGAELKYLDYRGSWTSVASK